MKGVIVSACICLLWVQLSAAAYTAWLDRDNWGGVGDFETYADFTTPPCGSGTPTRVQVRVRGSTTVILSTDQRIVVGPDYGLVCENVYQSGNCHDYKVRYADSSPQTSILFDRDNPGGTGDWELKSLITGNAWRAGTHITWNIGSGNYGNIDQKVTVGPALGLVCRNADQPGNCRDYEVRFNCPIIKSFPNKKTRINLE